MKIKKLFLKPFTMDHYNVRFSVSKAGSFFLIYKSSIPRKADNYCTRNDLDKASSYFALFTVKAVISCRRYLKSSQCTVVKIFLTFCDLPKCSENSKKNVFTDIKNWFAIETRSYS